MTEECIQAFVNGRSGWEEAPIPAAVLATLPPVQEPIQRAWHHFFREFVAHVEGAAYPGYPTFHDGRVAVEVMDIARRGQWWTASLIPSDRANN